MPPSGVVVTVVPCEPVGPTVFPPPRCTSPTTFGASMRPVLSPVNSTAQGKIYGFATHRRTLSPRPGPGAHLETSTHWPRDRRGGGSWLAIRAPETLEADRLKAKVNSLNLRLTGQLPHETLSPGTLKSRRNDLCKKIRSVRRGEYPSSAFTLNLDHLSTTSSVFFDKTGNGASVRSSRTTLRPSTAGW